MALDEYRRKIATRGIPGITWPCTMVRLLANVPCPPGFTSDDFVYKFSTDERYALLYSNSKSGFDPALVDLEKGTVTRNLVSDLADRQYPPIKCVTFGSAGFIMCFTGTVKKWYNVYQTLDRLSPTTGDDSDSPDRLIDGMFFKGWVIAGYNPPLSLEGDCKWTYTIMHDEKDYIWAFVKKPRNPRDYHAGTDGIGVYFFSWE